MTLKILVSEFVCKWTKLGINIPFQDDNKNSADRNRNLQFDFMSPYIPACLRNYVNFPVLKVLIKQKRIINFIYFSFY